MFLREWLYFDFVIKQATQAGMVTDCTHCFWKRGLAPEDLLGRVPRCLAGLCGVTKILPFLLDGGQHPLDRLPAATKGPNSEYR